MARPAIPKEQKIREGKVVHEYFLKAQKEEPKLTQDSLIADLGLTQGLFGQWLSGHTNIPDKRLIWLGARLKFNPYELRPSLFDYVYGGLEHSGRSQQVSEIVQLLTKADSGSFDQASRILKAALEEEKDTQK